VRKFVGVLVRDFAHPAVGDEQRPLHPVIEARAASPAQCWCRRW
jgi:hypothetical protein